VTRQAGRKYPWEGFRGDRTMTVSARHAEWLPAPSGSVITGRGCRARSRTYSKDSKIITIIPNGRGSEWACRRSISTRTCHMRQRALGWRRWLGSSMRMSGAAGKVDDAAGRGSAGGQPADGAPADRCGGVAGGEGRHSASAVVARCARVSAAAPGPPVRGARPDRCRDRRRGRSGDGGRAVEDRAKGGRGASAHPRWGRVSRR
jgi:hypothetical protein